MRDAEMRTWIRGAHVLGRMGPLTQLLCTYACEKPECTGGLACLSASAAH